MHWIHTQVIVSKCSNCFGSGIVIQQQEMGLETWWTQYICHVCKGTGEVRKEGAFDILASTSERAQ